jgi:hypothetical protein
MEKKLRYAVAIGWTILIFILLTSFTPVQTKSVKLELSVEEVNLVLEALGELPAKKSTGLINKIVMSANEQLKAK